MTEPLLSFYRRRTIIESRKYLSVNLCIDGRKSADLIVTSGMHHPILFDVVHSSCICVCICVRAFVRVYSARAMGHEISGANSYFRCAIPGLHLALQALIDYKGNLNLFLFLRKWYIRHICVRVLCVAANQHFRKIK
jgi:hypothetical protein